MVCGTLHQYLWADILTISEQGEVEATDRPPHGIVPTRYTREEVHEAHWLAGGVVDLGEKQEIRMFIECG